MPHPDGCYAGGPVHRVCPGSGRGTLAAAPCCFCPPHVLPRQRTTVMSDLSETRAVEHTTTASRDAVWSVLADGWTYAAWVVGTSRIRDVDPSWPAVGARIHHSVGAWPLLLDDQTEVIDADPGRLLVLRAKGWPAGEAMVQLELHHADSGGIPHRHPRGRRRRTAAPSGPAAAAAGRHRAAQRRDPPTAGLPGSGPQFVATVPRAQRFYGTCTCPGTCRPPAPALENTGAGAHQPGAGQPERGSRSGRDRRARPWSTW